MRAIRVPASENSSCSCVNLTDFNNITVTDERVIRCSANLAAVRLTADQRGRTWNVRATRNVTTVSAGFANPNLFIGDIVFVGLTPDGTLTDLATEFDASLLTR